MTAPTADATSTENDPTEPDAEDLLDAEDSVENGDTGEGDESELGDAGKKALDAMKAKWRAERARAKAAEDKLAAASKPAEETTDLDEIRQQARAEAHMESLKERVLDKIEAKAGGRFKDPEDALLRLGRNVDDYISDGKIDLEAIEEALVELLEKRPDFGVTQGEPKRFKGTADGGPKASAGGNPQLTEADVKKLSAAGKHAEIEAARMAGRLNNLLGITP